MGVGLGVGVGFGLAIKVMPQVKRRIGNKTNRVRIIRSNAFKSGRTKNKRFLHKPSRFRRKLCCLEENDAQPETFRDATCSNVRNSNASTKLATNSHCLFGPARSLRDQPRGYDEGH